MFLNLKVSNDSLFVFETENIENFVPDGKARWSILKNSENLIITTFDLSMSGKEFVCYGTNTLEKAKSEIPKVTGIGGIFFFSDEPENLKKWYKDHLGLEINEWGSTFETRNAVSPHNINYLQWSTFKNGSTYFEPSKKEFMINYRVRNLESLVEKLQQKGVERSNGIR